MTPSPAPGSTVAAGTGARFGRRLRVLKRGDFLRAKARGRRHFTPAIVFQLVPNDRPVTRLGVSISAKVLRRAVDRNRGKRLVREAFRLERGAFGPGVDVIAILKAEILKTGLKDVRRAVVDALRRAPTAASAGSGGAPR